MQDALADLDVLTLALSPSYTADHTIYAGTRAHGIRKSIDGGSTWFAVGAELSDASVNVLCFSPDFTNDNAIYAGLSEDRLLKSTDGGNNWDDLATFGADVNELAISPAFDPGSYHVRRCLRQDIFDLWIGAARGFCQRGLTAMALTDLEVSPGFTVDSTVFAATYDSGVFKSTDTGNTWHNISSGINHPVFTLAVSPDYANDYTLLAATVYGGIFRLPPAAANTGMASTLACPAGCT